MIGDSDQIDARDMRKGNFSWVQHELYTFFLPIIGREATHLYQVMAFMIPERQRSPVKYELSLRRIAHTAQMGKSTVQRELETLGRVGLVPQISQGDGRPSVFQLADLREIAALGEREVRRRMSVPQGDSGANGGGALSGDGVALGSAERGSGSGVAAVGGETAGESDAASSAGSDGAGVPQGDSGKDASEAMEKAGFSTLSEMLLSQKPGGTVPEKGGYCPTEADPFNVLNPIQPNLKTSPRQGGDGVVSSSQGNDLPSEGQELGEDDARAMREAVAKVMRECNLSELRLLPVIERQMRLQAGKVDEAADWNKLAEQMTDARKEYSQLSRDGLLRFGPYGLERFFSQGIWLDAGLWGINHELLQQRRSASVGRYTGT